MSLETESPIADNPIFTDEELEQTPPEQRMNAWAVDRERLDKAAESPKDRAADAGRSAPDVNKKFGYIFVDEIYPLGTGDIQLDDSKVQVRNPRDIEELSDEDVAKLSADFRENGQLAPIWVRPVKRGWELIAGERRLVAMKYAGEKKILARVFNVDLLQAMEMAIAEENHKKGWSEAAQGRAYKMLLALVQQEVDRAWAPFAELPYRLNWPAEVAEKTINRIKNEQRSEMATKIILEWIESKQRNKPEKPTVLTSHLETRTGVTRRHMDDMIRIADMDPEVHAASKKAGLGSGHLKLVAAMPTPRHQKKLFKVIVDRGLSAAQTAKEATTIAGRSGKYQREKKRKDVMTQNRTFEEFAEIDFGVWDLHTLIFNLDIVKQVLVAAKEHADEVKADKTFNKTALEAMEAQLAGLAKLGEELRTALKG